MDSKTCLDFHSLKAYWGEGTNRAQNWHRYSDGSKPGLLFEEGVDGYVPFAGRLRDILLDTLNKIKSTMSSCGCADIRELHENAVIQRVSEATLKENKEHDIHLLTNRGLSYTRHDW